MTPEPITEQSEEEKVPRNSVLGCPASGPGGERDPALQAALGPRQSVNYTHPSLPWSHCQAPALEFPGQRLIFPNFSGISCNSALLEGLSALLQILSPRVFPIRKAISTHPFA